MAEANWVLTDTAECTYIDQLDVTPDMVGGPADGYRVQKRRLHGGLSEGVDVVRLDNGSLSVDVLPTRGMGIWKAWQAEEAIGWNSPVKGPVHPAYVPLSDAGGLGWLDGFDELLVRCGLESNGAPEFDDQGRLAYGLHGRIANKPAHRVELRVNGDTGELTLTGIVDEVRFHFFKLRMYSTITLSPGENVISVRDTVENLSGSETEIQMLYHINLGPPLLGPGARVVAPVDSLVPRCSWAASGLEEWAEYGQPTAGKVEQVYFMTQQADSQHRSSVLLQNAAADRAFGLHYDTSQLPCFSLWKNETAESDGFVTGLEPATNYPNPRSFEQSQGRTVRLSPGATSSFDLQLQLYRGEAEVAQAVQQIRQLSKQQRTLYKTPQASWCADA